MAEKRTKEYPLCDRTDCFANRAERCRILNSTGFKKECPFYAHHDSVDVKKIEADIERYADTRSTHKQ